MIWFYYYMWNEAWKAYYKMRVEQIMDCRKKPWELVKNLGWKYYKDIGQHDFMEWSEVQTPKR